MIDQKIQQLGSNLLGAPSSDTRMAVDGIGRYREFKNGSVYWSPQTGAHEVHGAIRDKWLSLGGPAGELGYPVSDETTARDGYSRISRFQHGWISWNDRTGIQVQIETRRPYRRVVPFAVLTEARVITQSPGTRNHYPCGIQTAELLYTVVTVPAIGRSACSVHC